MRDGIEQTFAEHPRPKLSYPFEHGPKTGEAVDVAPGVKWLRMPLGGALAFINVWAIEEADGWAIVDTGMGRDRHGGTPGARPLQVRWPARP